MAVVEPFYLICKLIRPSTCTNPSCLYEMREWTTQWKRFMLLNCFFTTENALLSNFDVPPVLSTST